MTKAEFELIIQEEKELYLGKSAQKIKQLKKMHHKRYTIWRYLYYFRLCQYWRDVRQDLNSNQMIRRIAKVKYRYYDRKRNIYGEKAGVEIGIDNKIGRNCDIWHSGVVINGNIGDNCIFHGNNIIGNKGKNHEREVPTLGNNVDVGANVSIIGELQIADDCIIGAGAVITKSFMKQGSVIVGVPGRVLNKE